MMCMRNSTKPAGAACVAYFAATDASSEAGDICMPTPGWMTITEARPTTSARMVKA